MGENPWYREWFDTDYYHLLYNKRNDAEAEAFVTLLHRHLNLPAGAKVADIACGKGRHSRVLAALGCEVWGFDLSPNSIAYAEGLQTPHTHFRVQDIRDPYTENHFHAAFNLFTSFGYFESREDDIRCIRNIFQMLDPGGYFVQDYINGVMYIPDLPMEGTEIRGEVTFQFRKTFEDSHIKKCIHVSDHGQELDFAEKVKIYSAENLQEMHTSCGFKVSAVFGDYNLQTYNPASSPRIIIVSEK